MKLQLLTADFSKALFRSLLLIGLIASLQTLEAQTIVNSNVNSNQTWSPAGSPYIISQNVVVTTGNKLTILPGTRIRNAANYVIGIQGEVNAIGKSDTIILIDSVKFEFYKNSVGFNFSTNTGSTFKHCKFRGHFGYMALYLDETPLLVSNCTFSNFQYVARQLTSVATTFIKLRFENSTFEKGATNSNIIWPFGAKTELEMDKCTARNHGGGLMLSVKNKITNCYFYDWKNSMCIDFYQAQISVFTCNTFRKFNKTIFQFPIGGYYHNTDITIENNTFDSANRHIEYYTNNTATNSGTGIWSVKNNNFLHYVTNSIYCFGKTNSGFVDTLDFKNNYWNSTLSSQIANGISDNTDNNQIHVWIDHSSYLSSATVGCAQYECPAPDFSYSQNSSGIDFKDKSKSSKAYKVKWKFGDGNSDNSNNKTPSHNYSSKGSYNVCLYVTDANDVVCDSICKNVTYDPDKCKAAYYFGVDTSDKMTIYIFENSTHVTPNTKFKWDFGDGRSSDSRYPNHMYYKSGKFLICLTITDVDCNSTFCDTVNIFKEGVKIKVLKDPNQTGLDEVSKNMFSVYPNPSNSSLTINLNQMETNVTIQITDINGRSILTQNIDTMDSDGTLKLNVSELPEGMYYLSINTDKGTETKIITIAR